MLRRRINKPTIISTTFCDSRLMSFRVNTIRQIAAKEGSVHGAMRRNKIIFAFVRQAVVFVVSLRTAMLYEINSRTNWRMLSWRVIVSKDLHSTTLSTTFCPLFSVLSQKRGNSEEITFSVCNRVRNLENLVRRFLSKRLIFREISLLRISSNNRVIKVCFLRTTGLSKSAFFVRCFKFCHFLDAFM